MISRTAHRPLLIPSPSRFTSLRFASALPVGQGAQNGTPQETPELRLQFIKLYKELHRLGRDYPDPAYNFNARLRRAYEKNRTNTDPEKIQNQLKLAEHIKKEVLALIQLKKFRYLRRTYYNDAAR